MQSRMDKLGFHSGRLGQVWLGVVKGALNFLLPPRCLACQERTASPENLCPVCWRRLQFISHPVCERLGTPMAHDLGKGALCARAIAEPPIFDRARSAVVYEGVARKLVLGLKFAHQRETAGFMGRLMAQAGRALITSNTLIVPVPLHRLRLVQRRFNQSAELSRAVAREIQCEWEPLALQRSRHTRQQVGLSASARRKNVEGAFRLRKGYENAVHGRSVLLVDDVMTTGSTVSACTRVLKRAGAKDVNVLCFALAIDSGEIV